jgi:hypothetical protein
MDAMTAVPRNAFPRTHNGLMMLRTAVAVPAVSILTCIAILASRTLSPRSPYIAVISLIIDTMSVIEVISFTIFLRSLVKSYVVRTIGNVLLGVLGGLSLLPALAVVILIVDGSFRHVGV